MNTKIPARFAGFLTSIRSLLVAGLGLILLLTLFNLGIGYSGLQQVRNNVTGRLEHANLIRQAGLDFERAFLLARQNEINYFAAWVSGKSDASLSVLEKSFHFQIGVAHKHLDSLDVLVGEASDADLAQIRATLQLLRPELDTYQKIIEDEIKAAAESQTPSPISSTQGVVRRIEQLSETIRSRSTQTIMDATDKMLQVSENSQRSLLLSGLTTLPLALLLVVLVARRILSPLEMLTTAARQIGQGNLAQNVQLTWRDEFATLAESFNLMSARLNELVGLLEQRVADRTAELAHQAELMDVVNHVGRYVTLMRDRKVLLPTIVDLIRAAFDLYSVTIFLPEQNEGGLGMRAETVSFGGEKPFEQLWVAEGAGFVGWVQVAGEPLVVDNVETDERYIAVDNLNGVCSELALPLRVGGEVLGVLDLQSQIVSHFRQQDVPVYQTLADQIAISLYNARLFQAEASARQSADTLREIGQVIGSTLVLDEVLERILSSLRKVLPYDSVSIMTLKGDSLYIQAVRGFQDAEPLQNFRLPLENYVLNRVVVERIQPMVLPDVNLDPRWENVITPGANKVNSWMGIPLIVSGRVTGMLTVDSFRANTYSEDHLPMAVAFANQTAIALENARLFQETRLRARQLSHLNELGRTISGELDRAKILEMLASRIRELIEVDCFMVALYDPQQESLSFPGLCDDHKLVQSVNLSLAKYPWYSQVITTGEPQIVLLDAAQAEAAAGQNGSNIGFPSMLLAPLRVGEHTLGVIAAYSRQPAAFNQDQLDLLVSTAQQTAVAWHNAQLFEEAEAARTEAVQANRLKSQFLANMSHELRTPLNSIINFAYLLTLGTEGLITEGQADLLKRIEDAGHHLLGMINDILDLAKIEAGRLELYFEEVEVNEIIEGVIPTAAGLLRNKPVKLNSDLQSGLPLVKADRTRLRQVLLNLLSNSAKFTEQGEITVRTTQRGDFVQISVSDTGIGMAEQDIPKAFAEFVQVHGELSRPVGGTGLGLPISRRFVEMHGGKIWAESHLGAGSTFYFTLPALRPNPSVGRENEPLEARVLVIDDDPGILQTVFAQLSQDYQVLTLNDSRQALEKVRQNRPDVVVLDVMMPHQDGWEVLKELKSDPDVQDIPVIICSILHEQGLALSLGADDYLVKPVNQQLLNRMISHYAGPGGKVLAVDDDPDALQILRRSLGGMAYHVFTAESGPLGLAVAREENPDVIVLDLMMPGMSGFEVLSQMRNEKRLKEVPVIVVTAKDLSADEQAWLQEEAAVLLQKGQFSQEEFKRAIRNAVLRGSAKGREP